MPQRIQRRRTKGWQLPDNAACVDRTTGYGNPWDVDTVIAQGQATNNLQARAVAVGIHDRWLDGYGPDRITSGRRTFDRRWVLANLHTLAGKKRACYCPEPAPGEPDICHAVTLGERADRLVTA
jgi:hypothetical protein